MEYNRTLLIHTIQRLSLFSVLAVIILTGQGFQKWLVILGAQLEALQRDLLFRGQVLSNFRKSHLFKVFVGGTQNH